MYRQLVKERGKRFLPELSRSLNNTGLILRDLGYLPQAVREVREAVRICRRLEKKQPGAYRPEFAASLNNLGSLLRRCGRLKEALKISRESVSLGKDSDLPGLSLLAHALMNLGNLLGDTGSVEEALQAFERSAALLRQGIATGVAPASPPDLATVLNNLALAHFTLGQAIEALDCLAEAVKLWQELIPDHPVVAIPGLAMTCMNRGVILAETGFLPEAEAAARKAVELYRHLDQERPQMFSNDLAMSLDNLREILDLQARSPANAPPEPAKRTVPATREHQISPEA